MIVREPTEMEVERAAEVASEAFGISIEQTGDVFGRIADVFGRRFILVAEMDGRLVSSLICWPGPIYVGEGRVTHAAVGYVGTLPECRKTGYAGALMTECARLLRREGLFTSSLWPFSYPYYRRFGWELGSHVWTCIARSEVWTSLADAGQARWAAEDDLGGVKAVYNAHAPAYNCMTQRSDEWWERILKMRGFLGPPGESGIGCAVHVADGIVDGYAAFEVKTTEEGALMQVKEAFAQAPEHRRQMLALIATANPEGRVAHDAPPDDTILHEVPDPWSLSVKLRPSFQFRVVDPPRAMESLVADGASCGRLSFAISDPVFEEGFEFGVEFDGGRASLCPFDACSAIETDVQTLAKLYSGYLSPRDALKLERIRVRGSEERVLELAQRVFATGTPYRSWMEPG